MAERHDFTSNAICPHCGHTDRDSWELNGGEEGDFIATCGSCGEEYHCSRDISVSYSTRPIDGVGGNIPHTFAPPDADTDDSMEGGKNGTKI